MNVCAPLLVRERFVMPSSWSVRVVEGVDFRRYARAPALNALQCVPLARLLRKAAPDPLTELEARALMRIEQAASDVTARLDARSGRVVGGTVKPSIATFYEAWIACHEALTANARLRSARGERARVLLSILFSRGRSFLCGDPVVIWSEGDRKLGRLRAESSKTELAEIVGEEIATWLEESARELRDAIGCGERTIEEPDTASKDVIRNVQRAIAAYGRALAASVDENDPESVRRFERAVTPLDELRTRQRTKRARIAP